MDDDEADRLHDSLVAALFHPPRIVPVGVRMTNRQSVLIVSHIELWPWRTSIAGSVASANGIERDHTRGREQADWFARWSMSDDTGTDYRQQGAGSRGNDFCSDFQIRFQPGPPADATLLRVTTPDGEVVDVGLSHTGD